MRVEFFLCLAVAILLTLFLLVSFILIRRLFIVATVQHTSMSPTLEHGDIVLVWRYWPRRWLRKGQIVVVKPWGDFAAKLGNGETLLPCIKRVAGLPGDTIVASPNGTYEMHKASSSTTESPEGTRTWHIPPGHLFVKSDNPLGGWDSVTWGPAPFTNVLGIAVTKIRSSKMGRVAEADQYSHASANNANNRNEIMQTPAAGLLVGSKAPDFRAETLSGQTVASDMYSGQVRVLLFITPSPLSRAVIPLYEELLPKAKARGATLLLVSLANMAQTRAFLDHIRGVIDVLVAPPETNAFSSDFQVPGTPYYYLVDAGNTIRDAGFARGTLARLRSLLEVKADSPETDI